MLLNFFNLLPLAADVAIRTPAYSINLTFLLAIIAICLTAFGVLIKVYGKKKNPEELPGTSPYCKRHEEKIKEIEGTIKEGSTERNRLKDIIHENEKQITGLTRDSENQGSKINETKQENKELASKLDTLLKQLLDWMNSY